MTAEHPPATLTWTYDQQPTPIGELLRQWVRDNAPDNTCPACLLDKSRLRSTTWGDLIRDAAAVDS